MKRTFQTENLNVLEHGYLVWKYYQKLLNNDLDGMKIPDWFHLHKDTILQNLLPKDIIETYTIYHDIGKVECLVIDELGKRHFPNHASHSENIWLSLEGDPLIAKLMGLDMVFHTEDYNKINNRMLNYNIILTLILAALAELHANASMFGGITSESFCI
ncbi:MAG: hypothetical protein AABY22_12405, partial [Nanoarchaeota archaeon]